jgi:membrane protein Man1
MPHPNSTSTPITSPSGTPSASWQGAAFNSLNRNVAASCLKIRHMFDPQHARMNSPRTSNSTGGSNPNWIWQVKEEILRRCAATSPPAAILHIAVDTENAEGCVYVKAQNTEEAGKVFRILHGKILTDCICNI